MTVFKLTFLSHCQLVSIRAFSTFEIQLLSVDWNGPILIALIYRPPYFVNDFVFEFTDLLGFITTNYDCFLLVGDFNVYVCCPSNTLSNEFLTLIESFNLVNG